MPTDRPLDAGGGFLVEDPAVAHDLGEDDPEDRHPVHVLFQQTERGIDRDSQGCQKIAEERDVTVFGQHRVVAGDDDARARKRGERARQEHLQRTVAVPPGSMHQLPLVGERIEDEADVHVVDASVHQHHVGIGHRLVWPAVVTCCVIVG